MLTMTPPPTAIEVRSAELLREARQLLAARGELDARGRLRRHTRTAADARRRLVQLQVELAANRRRRLLTLKAELLVHPVTPASSIGWRRDPQGRLRPISWETGSVVVTAQRGS